MQSFIFVLITTYITDLMNTDLKPMEHDSIFLLGGADLEMSVIREILSEKGFNFSDNSHSWDNAVLSSYADELVRFGARSDWVIYGIELSEDMDIPSNYIRIDHHNDYNDRKSSLEQILELMDIPPTRFHMLVAANDSAYIPGMRRMGATDQEISWIRRLDREAQGVTEEDERLAEESVTDNISRHGNILVVKSLTYKFSPICDRLYPYSRLLIYTDDVWTFYGEGASRLHVLFREEIKNGSIFYGGGENGYVGSVRNSLSQQDIYIQIKKIIYEFE